jgi:hypothetical protein
MSSNQEQAEMMAAKFKDMNPNHVELLVKLAAVAQALYLKYQQLKKMAQEQPLLVLGLMLLVVAVLLRLLGIL